MTLTITAKGQVTLKKEALRHLGVKPGERVDLELLPDQSLKVSSTRRTGTIEDFIGCLAGKTTKKATLEELNEAAADGWAGLR